MSRVNLFGEWSRALSSANFIMRNKLRYLTSILLLATVFFSSSAYSTEHPQSNYQLGYNEGCAAAHAKLVTDKLEQHVDLNYATGWNAGYAYCKTEDERVRALIEIHSFIDYL